ncbi:MAG: hypothetical protein K6G61_09695 [Solobacterium sp.]|nr:hypothetical protein [Solobacterium sp.]
MRKFGIISGFLGAGKTTAMIALKKYYAQKGLRCDLIVNDLGDCDMVDAAYSETCGVSVHSMPGGCICHRTRELKDVLDGCFAAGTDLVLSDIPGCGIGGLDGVYRRFSRNDTELAPYTVIVSPQDMALLYDDETFNRIHLPRDMAEILKAHLEEADIAVLNKTDTIAPGETEKLIDMIRSFRPDIPVFPVSAKYGTGISTLADHILSAVACMDQPEGLADKEEIIAPLERLSWYDCRYYVKVCCDDFSPDDYLRDLMETARFSFAAMNANIPHLKVFASGQGGDHAKYSLTGIDYPLQKDCLFAKRAAELAVVINARLLCPPVLAAQIMKACIDGAGKKHDLDTMIFSSSCQ